MIPPSDELSLLEEKREAEAEAELSTTMGSGKVKGEPVMFSSDFAGLQMGRQERSPSTRPKTKYGIGCHAC